MLLCAAGPVLGDCSAPKMLAPADRVTTELRPAIRWTATGGASAYALKVRSRVPEGRVVASFDVAVKDTHFVPPAALANERAKVTVSLAARCKEASSASVETWFLIDATPACPPPSRVRIKLENGRAIADWTGSAEAVGYEVRLHSPLDGYALKAVETREPRASLEGDLPQGAVLSVRPRCAHGFGEPALGFLLR